MALPTFKSDDKDFMLHQSSWSAQLNPVLSNPMTNPTILPGIILTTGTNVINHRLGKKPIGWLLIDNNAAVSLYRSAEFNSLTLTLVASAPATVTLAVF